MNTNLPLILANHTPTHTLIDFITSPWFLLGAGVVVALLVVNLVGNRSAKK